MIAEQLTSCQVDHHGLCGDSAIGLLLLVPNIVSEAAAAVPCGHSGAFTIVAEFINFSSLCLRNGGPSLDIVDSFEPRPNARNRRCAARR